MLLDLKSRLIVVRGVVAARAGASWSAILIIGKALAVELEAL